MMMISTSAVSTTTWITPTTLFCFINLIILTIFLISRWKKPDDDPHPQISRVDSLRAAATPTGPGPSILQRVKSIDFSSSFQRFNQYSHDSTSKSKSVVVVETSATAQVVKSSVTEKDDKPSTATTSTTTTILRERKGKSGVSRESVDEKADDFINRFRQQLKLQRLDSIMRYKEMLSGGGGDR